MQIGIYVNKNKDPKLEKTTRILEIADKYGLKCNVLSDVVSESEKIAFAKKSDMIISLGGDGTVLRIASAASKTSTPIMAINLGNLGFLTEVCFEDAEEAIKNIAEANYEKEKRMMLTCRAGDKCILALNDVCVQRISRSKLLKFSVNTEREYVDSFSADGVLISSPTGSTAYSLSCGGPVISPKVSALLMTPVCAHTLRARPILFAEEEKISVFSKEKCGFAIICDGVHIADFDSVTEVEISKAEEKLEFITFGNKSFFTRLNSKLNEWNVGVEK